MKKKMNMGIFRMGNNGCQTSKGEILATLKTMHGSLLLMQQVKNVFIISTSYFDPNVVLVEVQDKRKLHFKYDDLLKQVFYSRSSKVPHP